VHVALTPWADLTVDGFLRYVDELERQRVPDYTELNFRIGWRARPDVELALVGADLLHDSHPESGTVPTATNPDPLMFELERAVWLDVVWNWR
jgi:iron complex outermembrane receptor protein